MRPTLIPSRPLPDKLAESVSRPPISTPFSALRQTSRPPPDRLLSSMRCPIATVHRLDTKMDGAGCRCRSRKASAAAPARDRNGTHIPAPDPTAAGRERPRLRRTKGDRHRAAGSETGSSSPIEIESTRRKPQDERDKARRSRPARRPERSGSARRADRPNSWPTNDPADIGQRVARSRTRSR